MPRQLQEPYYQRPDLTPFLIHLTKEGNERSALQNLTRILKTGRIQPTDSFVRAGSLVKVASFMDVPFMALKYVCSERNRGRYEPFGLFVTKKTAYNGGARPVMYVSESERRELELDPKHWWRTVNYEYQEDEQEWIDWQHEREWRCPGLFTLPKRIAGVLVKSLEHVEKLSKKIQRNADAFACLPRSIIPVEVICQGLDY